MSKGVENYMQFLAKVDVQDVFRLLAERSEVAMAEPNGQERDEQLTEAQVDFLDAIQPLLKAQAKDERAAAAKKAAGRARGDKRSRKVSDSSDDETVAGPASGRKKAKKPLQKSSDDETVAGPASGSKKVRKPLQKSSDDENDSSSGETAGVDIAESIAKSAAGADVVAAQAAELARLATAHLEKQRLAREAREEQEREAKEEQERKAKEEQERKAKEKEARDAQIRAIVTSAKFVDLTDD